MIKTLADGTVVTLWDKGELPMRATRIIEHTGAKVRIAIERIRKALGVPPSTATEEWWKNLSEANRQQLYEEQFTDKEREDFDLAQDGLIVGMVREWSRPEPCTMETVAALKGPLWRELSTYCTEVALPSPDFGNEQAADPLARTGNSDSSETSPGAETSPGE